jgi:hypothetical protein
MYLFYAAWDVMILMRANPLQGPLEGVGPENRDFLGPETATRKANVIWAQKRTSITNVCHLSEPP